MAVSVPGNHLVGREGSAIVTTLREIDQKIVEAVRQVSGNKPVPLDHLTDELSISRDYLTARLRAMRVTDVLPADVAFRVPEGRKRVPDDKIIDAWRSEATVSEVARKVGLSRAAVLQRVARLRTKGLHLRTRPHAYVLPEERQRRLREAISGKSA